MAKALNTERPNTKKQIFWNKSVKAVFEKIPTTNERKEKIYRGYFSTRFFLAEF